MSSTKFLWGKFAVYTTAIMAGGWGIMRYSIPTDEQFYDALSPELKRKVDAIRAQKEGSSTMKQQFETAGAQDQVIWGDQQPSKPPGRRV